MGLEREMMDFRDAVVEQSLLALREVRPVGRRWEWGWCDEDERYRVELDGGGCVELVPGSRDGEPYAALYDHTGTAYAWLPGEDEHEIALAVEAKAAELGLVLPP